MNFALIAASHPFRREILDHLRRRPMIITDLTLHFPVTRQAVTKHVRLLQRGGLVRIRKEGRERVVELVAGPLREIDRWLDKYRAYWKPRLGRLKRLAEAMERKPRCRNVPQGSTSASSSSSKRSRRRSGNS